jgi:hypothetical protein
MPLVTITFSNPLNTSVQVGDTAYYANTTTLGGFNTQNLNNVSSLGLITIITPWNGTISSIQCNCVTCPPFPILGSYIMFSKDNKANMSSILGYYAEVEFKNNSKVEAELFSVGAEVFESSK